VKPIRFFSFSVLPRPAHWLAIFIAAACFTAPRPLSAATPATLSFNVNVHATQGMQTTRAMSAKVLLRGERVRIENGDNPKIVTLWVAPYLYRLLPNSRSGVRSRSQDLPVMAGAVPNWTTLWQQPTRIRSVLKAKGARKIATPILNGVATEVYTAKNWQSMNTPTGNVRLQNVRLWLRRSDALPVKLESSASGWKVVATWNNYQRNPKLSSSLFEVPKGFRIRDAAH
jgi:hypothetical protein